MKNKKLLSMMSFIVVFLMMSSTLQLNQGLQISENSTSIENTTNMQTNFSTKDITLPSEPIPDWEINITNTDMLENVTLTLSDLIDFFNNDTIDAYEEYVIHHGNNQTVIGFDLLNLVQKFVNGWNAGGIEVCAEDGFCRTFSAEELVYSLYSYEPNVKILLAFAVNGSYLPNTDWADDGALRMVVPSNDKYTYFGSYWVTNVTLLEVNDQWTCDFYINGQYNTSVTALAKEEYSDIVYLENELTYHGEPHLFGGPSIASILDLIGIISENITEFKASAPDANQTIPVSSLTDAALATTIDRNYLGFNGGPFRLVGLNLNMWDWLKNVHAIYITLNTTTTTTPTETTTPVPGYLTLTGLGVLLAIHVISKKKRK
ncbi:MAG: hypothetical protein U9O98_06840 [Asgard group archaeon]|nr:hypothetical protein [Asgard group archaeon]